MKALIDTNVILDVLIKREHFYLDGAKIWSYSKENFFKGFLSAISINNLYYIIKKLKSKKIAETFVDEIIEDFNIISLTKSILKQARTISTKDFEDLIQYFSSLQEGCDYIVTRNKKDFPSLGIKIVSPFELIKLIESI